jgi:hypothetical protein
MAIMKRVFYAFAVAALCLLTACGKDKQPGKEESKTQAPAIAGVWELSDIATKASVGSVNVSVYLDFASDGNFTLYQKIGEGRYTKFTGTYALDKDSLSGKYSDGKAWGPYKAEINASALTLTKEGGNETDTYRKIDAVPETVTTNLY